jgi:hypothetical protein
MDEMIVCDPHRNALISKDGDKSDAWTGESWRRCTAADSSKRCIIRQSLERSLFKQHVQLYHDRVNHRVSEAQKIIWRVRRLGVFIKQKDLIDEGVEKGDDRQSCRADEVVRKDVELLLEGFDLAAEQVHEMRRRLIELAKKESMIEAFRAICRRGLGTGGDVPGVRGHAVPVQKQREALEVHGHRPGAASERRRPGKAAECPGGAADP